MPKTPKTSQPEAEREPVSEKRDEQRAWAEDQKKHEYYYDDAHGYETYDPQEDDDDEKSPGLIDPDGKKISKD